MERVSPSAAITVIDNAEQGAVSFCLAGGNRGPVYHYKPHVVRHMCLSVFVIM